MCEFAEAVRGTPLTPNSSGPVSNESRSIEHFGAGPLGTDPPNICHSCAGGSVTTGGAGVDRVVDVVDGTGRVVTDVECVVRDVSCLVVDTGFEATDVELATSAVLVSESLLEPLPPLPVEDAEPQPISETQTAAITHQKSLARMD